MTVQPFLFGKLPAHGDFVARGLATGERDRWDAWGAEALTALRVRAGAGFDQAHGVAPAWRFVTVSAAGWRAGAIAPSIDGVGRRFFLLVGVNALSPATAAGAGLALADVAEALIFDAIATGMNADRVSAEALARFAQPLAGAPAAELLASSPAADGVWWTMGGPEASPACVRGREPPADLFARTIPVSALLEEVA